MSTHRFYGNDFVFASRTGDTIEIRPERGESLKITGVANPVNQDDAVNKFYVDATPYTPPNTTGTGNTVVLQSFPTLISPTLISPVISGNLTISSGSLTITE